jgi:hypothetical protein
MSPDTCRIRVRPNTYEVSSCQETNDPYERFFSFFSAYRAGAVYSQSRVLT